MEKIVKGFTRRECLKVLGAAAGLVAIGFLAPLRAEESIRLGTLCPLTGAGGSYGPEMQRVIKRVVKEINDAGGIHGQPIELFHEDSQTNPEAAVRAVRKLIDVNNVSAVMSTWASGVTMAVAPVCFRNKVLEISVSGADVITTLEDDDYIFRTQPNSNLQGQVYGRFAVDKGWKKIAYMARQAPYAQSFGEAFREVVEDSGAKIVEFFIYEADRSSYRSELTKVLAKKPELIFLMGYTPDSIVALKEIYKTGYEGAILGPSFAINQKLVDSVGAAVAEGVYSIDPATDLQSPAFKNVTRLMGTDEVSAYAVQSYDHINLIALAIAAGKDASGTGIRDHIRDIANPPGQKIGNFLEGIKLLNEGKEINYQGASGACDFDQRGDILSRPFSFSQVKNGKIVVTGRIKI
jgi:branched-chain amino acid transport system substrate-binding protein